MTTFTPQPGAAPAPGRWTEVAAHTRDRTYHNSALLLPDMVSFGSQGCMAGLMELYQEVCSKSE